MYLQRRQLIQGHNSRCEATSAFDFNAFAPASWLHSTADDLLTYMEAHLQPHYGKLPAQRCYRRSVRARDISKQGSQMMIGA